jgi:hypothetical protein
MRRCDRMLNQSAVNVGALLGLLDLLPLLCGLNVSMFGLEV